jgi:hypothetical protein
MPVELPAPDPLTGVPRNEVHEVVRDMMTLDPRVRWISIVLDEVPGSAETFTVTPFVVKPF